MDYFFTRNFDAPRTAGSKPFAEFRRETIKDERATRMAGSPQFKEVVKCKIHVPGDRNLVVEKFADRETRERFSEAWEAFERQESIAPDGTPIDQWPYLAGDPGRIRSLKFNDIYTVEAVAGVTDSNLEVLGLGGRTLRSQAQAFLEAAHTGAVPAKLVEENERLNDKVTALTAQLADMAARFEGMLRQTGQSVAEHENPVAEARESVRKAARLDVEIPDNFRTLGVKRLKEIAEELDGSVVVRDKETAIEVIETFVERRQAA